MITFRKLGKLGRFGNQLFQYSGVRLYAELNGFNFSFPKWVGNNLFEKIEGPSTLKNALVKLLPTAQLDDIKSYTKTSKIKYYLKLQENLPQLTKLEDLYKNPRDNINLYGYLQDPLSLDLLKKHKGKVLNWFKFKYEIEGQIISMAEEFEPWVGVHIRRGDLVKRNITVSVSDIKKVLREIVKDRNVYIASDDPHMADQFKEFNVFIPEIPTNVSRFIFDFLMLKNAQTVIGCGSTFSWWAAYLGNKNDFYSPPLTHLWKDNSNIEINKMEI